MLCPLCIEPALDERHSHGIEVDVCPKCSGVWLDRGELEKLVSMTALPTLENYEPPDSSTSSSEEQIPHEDQRRGDESEAREAWQSDRRRDSDDDGRGKERKSKSRKFRNFGDRLEYVFDDVLDLDDLFDL